MAAKVAGAPADRGDRVHHFHHREEVVATTIGLHYERVVIYPPPQARILGRLCAPPYSPPKGLTLRRRSPTFSHFASRRLVRERERTIFPLSLL